MTIMIDDRQELFKPNGIQELVESSVRCAIETENISGEFQVSVIFVDNEQIKEINRDYRNIDRPTDVLSFPMMDYGDNHYYRNICDDMLEVDRDTGEVVLGDIAISLERAYEQSLDYGHSFQREVAFLTVHGTLHLLGYDHEIEEDRNIMREMEEKILGRLNLTR